MDSILDSVKSYLGILSDDTSFDSDILMDINAVMFTVNQLGAGPSETVIVEDATQEWVDYFDESIIGAVRQYVNMKVKMLFDPSSNNQIMDALKEQIAEAEWRILAYVDNIDYSAREVESE